MISSFFILPFWWALSTIVFVAFISPLLAMPIFAPFKKPFFHKTKLKSQIAGASEALVFIIVYLFIQKLTTLPDWLFVVAIAEYIINQVVRAQKYMPDIGEWHELIGFVAVIVAGFLANTILLR